MIYNRTGRAARGAFTLVEILVVILIIALLVSLLMAGVMKVLVQGPQLKTGSEIRQFDVAIQQFMQEHNVNYIPSFIVLCEDGSYNPSIPADMKSKTYLQRIFGKNVNLNKGSIIDWNGNGQMDGRLTLEGEHCLTFFLGGIPSAPSAGVNTCLGFSTNPTNPATAGGTRRGPYYQNWESARLIRDDGTPSGISIQQNGFFVYRDAWKAPAGRTPQPYAYFSAYGVQNGYKTPWTLGLLPSDCNGLGLKPYFSGNPAQPTFANPNTYQIISAGKDCVFGTGGLWNPLGGGNTADPNGNDNQSNFAKGIIEAGQ